MDRWKNKVAVVTGASSGIGAAIAFELVKHGMKVIGVARRVEKITEMKSQIQGPGELHALKMDVGNEQEINEAFQFVREKFQCLHVLVNNAGIARPGLISKQSSQHMKDVLSINVLGVTLCTQRALAVMKESNVRDGHIININSTLGHKLDYFTDATAMYGPSKFALTALTEVFRREMRNAKKLIKVTSISPGQVKTEIVDSANMAVGGNFALDEFGYVAELDAKDVADAVVYALSTPPHLLIQELTIKHVQEQF